MDADFISILKENQEDKIIYYLNENGKRKPVSPIFFSKEETNQARSLGGNENEQ